MSYRLVLRTPGDEELVGATAGTKELPAFPQQLILFSNKIEEAAAGMLKKASNRSRVEVYYTAPEVHTMSFFPDGDGDVVKQLGPVVEMKKVPCDAHAVYRPGCVRCDLASSLQHSGESVK